jgi:hypothetical protein
MTGFTQNEPPNVGKDAIIISAIIFLIAALSGHLA